ncbi:MAG TPA: retropepsin-like aspartic protease [Candidatus Elarobacter sp.]|nr:retropepsin-like aspartic protease [Candidatus Elarobacter sp.]
MRFALRSLALATAAGVLGAAPPPDPLAALTALAAANGHAAGVHLRATGTRVVEGRTVTVAVDQLGTRRLVRHCVNEVCGGTWFDGEREWTYGLNEVVLPEEADEATLIDRTLGAIVSYAFAEPAFRAGGGSVSRDPQGRWHVRARDGVELVATVDPAAQAVRRVQTANGVTVGEYGRETRAGGATFALDRTGPFEPGPLDQVSAVAGPVGPPAGVMAAVGSDAPVRLGAEPIPIVPCTIGGRAVRCLLDTGATPSAVTLPVAEALNQEPHGELEISGLGRFATGFIEAGPLAVGAARFERARFAVIPPSNAARFDVVVGSDLLGRVRLVLDRARGTARLLPAGGPAPVGTAVRLSFHNGSPLVAAMLGPQGTRALLDTGDQAALSLGYAAFREGPQWPVIERGSAVGVAGADDTFTVAIPEVRLGGLALGTTRATVRRTQTVPHAGIGLWDRFVLDLDEEAERISFSPR